MAACYPCGMCGRYSLSQAIALVKRFDLWNSIELTPNESVVPGAVMPVVIHDAVNRLQMMKWGLVPPWAKDPDIGFRLINARAETLSEKPSYRDAYRCRRCLVPADGFYEWKKDGSRKTPVFLRLRDRGLFAFAGLYEHWRDTQGAVLTTYTIVTTEPNEIVGAIHDRMPVILRREDEAEWLDPSRSDAACLQRLLVPYASEEMEAFPVPGSNRPNSAPELPF